MFKEIKAHDLQITKPGIHVVKVDSEIARKWLTLNIKNRRIRKSLVMYLRRQINEGEWQPNHPQPVVFSDAGRLIDGQHRLTAIAESEIYNGESVKVRVETGADDRIREYMDTGITRTLEDRVELDSNPAINKFAAQMVAINFSFTNGKANVQGKATPEDAKEFYAIHKNAIHQVFERKRSERGTGQAAVSFAALEYFELDENKADEFYSDLFVPAGNVQQSQMLRDFLCRLQTSGGFANRQEAYQKSVSCMKAHLADRKIGKVTRANW